MENLEQDFPQELLAVSAPTTLRAHVVKSLSAAILSALESLVDRMEHWNGTLLEAAALDLEVHRMLWKAAGNPYLERALNAVMVPLFAHKTLEHVTRDVRRWRMSHHRVLLDAVTGRSGDDPQAVLLTHMRMAYTEPERYSTLARKPS